MIEVDLVTGFLGSGKTTFIRKYAEYIMSTGRKIGILENDHGAINVDMLLLNDMRSDMCELEMVAGGCDADCHRRRFKTKLISMAMSGYDRIIIEPSGVFDVDEFFDALREEPLDNWYEIGNVFCIVDGGLPDKLSDEEEYLLASQAACAGKIIVSHAGKNNYVNLSGLLDHINSSLARIDCGRVMTDSEVIAADIPEMPAEDLGKLSGAGYRICDFIKKYTLESLGFETVCYLEQKMDRNKFEQLASVLFASDEYGHVLRVKGYTENEDGQSGKWTELNATKSSLSVRETPVGQEVIIIIGTDLAKQKIDALIGTQSAI